MDSKLAALGVAAADVSTRIAQTHHSTPGKAPSTEEIVRAQRVAGM